MKKLLIGLLLLAGCSPKEKYVDISNFGRERTVTVGAYSIIKELHLVVNNGYLTVEQSTVTVHFIGSGVRISPTGHVLSCAHVFNEGDLQKTEAYLIDGSTVPFKLLIIDKEHDLAIGKIPLENLEPYAALAGSVEVGQEVIAVGSPYDFRLSVSNGIISGIDRNLDIFTNLVQTNAAINPGNSGGPLFNLDGEIVGINTRIITDSCGMGFAVSVPTIKKFLSVFDGLKLEAINGN